jgi:hypothetical protein
MSKSVSNLPDPAYWLRQFIFNELKKYPSDEVAVVSNQTFVPISPSLSQAAEADFYESLVQSTGLEQPLWIQYDKLMRFRTNPFYRIKKEQLILTINHPDIDIADNVTTIIEQLLDREDAAAQDLNDWARENADTLNVPHNVFFHNIKVYQADETRDVLELASARTVFINKLIIEYDYNAKDGSTFK